MSGIPAPWETAQRWAGSRSDLDGTIDLAVLPESAVETENSTEVINLHGVQVPRNAYPALQRNATQVKDNHRTLPKPIVVKMMMNGHPVRALLDSGSLGDFLSSTLADQLKVKREPLETPLSLQLAVQGSRSKINARSTVHLEYQEINEHRVLDIININNYDLILGTP